MNYEEKKGIIVTYTTQTQAPIEKSLKSSSNKSTKLVLSLILSLTTKGIFSVR